jgi:hypothetical protein
MHVSSQQNSYFLVDNNYHIGMIQLEHNWILARDGASLHHITLQRKHTYTTQFKENRQWSKETFCGMPIEDTELPKWRPEAAAWRRGRLVAAPVGSTTTTGARHQQPRDHQNRRIA